MVLKILLINWQTAEVRPFAMWMECVMAFGRGLCTVWLMSVVSGKGCSFDLPKFVGGIMRTLARQV